MLLLALAYMVAANLGRLFAYDLVTPVWPPTGVALAALLIGGLRLWPGVALGELLVVVIEEQPFSPPVELPLVSSLMMATGNTIEALLGAWLLRRVVGFTGCFDRVTEVAGLVVFPIAVGATVSATFGVLALEWAGSITAADMPDSWFVWWVGNALGVLVITPAVMVWREGLGPRLPLARVPELLLLLGGLAAAAAHSVLGVFPSMPLAARETYLLFPFLVWAALRFGPRVSATVVFLVASIALAANAHRFGAYGAPLVDVTVLRTQVFVGVISISMLLLAASVEERQRACARIDSLQHGLREEVARRTAELEEANRLLAARNAELASFNADLDAFASRVAHDLRAPVRAVNGFATLLRASYASKLDEEGVALLDRITRAAARMGRLIDGLLDITRLGRHALDLRPVDMEALARAVAENLEGADEVDIQIGALPPCRCDAALLEEVFENLLQNAVKYTRGVDSPRVEVGGARFAGSVVYWVRDNGVGFPMEEAPKLFRVFSRLHGAQFEGSGVGLATVRRIVDLHGGHVWAEGKVGGGATFSFRLPSPEPAPRRWEAAEGVEHHPGAGGVAGGYPPPQDQPSDNLGEARPEVRGARGSTSVPVMTFSPIEGRAASD